LTGILGVAIEQTERQPVGLEAFCYPKPRMVAAFAAARTSRSDMATNLLDQYLADERRETTETGANLRRALWSVSHAESSRQG
jgi:hypothetical protein